MNTKTKQIAGAVIALFIAILVVAFINNLQSSINDSKITIQELESEKLQLHRVVEEKNNEIDKLLDENNSLNQRIEEMRGSLSSRGARGVEIGVVELTAYETGGTCANGMPAQFGVVAVDPSVIPLGSQIYIEVDGMPEYNGIYTAADTGGAVNGNIIDICMDSGHFAFGRRSGRAWFVD